MFIWNYTREVNAKHIREHYLQAFLWQDVAFFDNVGAGEVAIQNQTDTCQLTKIFINDLNLIYLTAL